MPISGRIFRMVSLALIVSFGLMLALTQSVFASNAGSSKKETLRDEAKKLGIHIGSAVSYSALTNDATYAQILGDQFSAITPENEMKWASVEATRGVYDFTQADAEVAFAQAHHQLVRGHNLVWDSQLPNWLTSGTFTSAQLKDILRQHIFTEVGHFRGQIWEWDVVNEPFNGDGTLKATMWLNALGPDYIA